MPSKDDQVLSPCSVECNFNEQKQLAIEQLEKKIKKIKNRWEERLQMLNHCKSWQNAYHQGQLLHANLFRMTKGMKEIAVSDWEQHGIEKIIALDPLVNPQDQVAAYFRRSRKLKAGIAHAKRLIEAVEKEFLLCERQKHALDEVKDPKALTDYLKIYGDTKRPPLKSSIKKDQSVAKPYREYLSQSGVKIWVGKSAKDNDKLTFHCAKSLDWWMHARNYPGSHIVIRCHKDQSIDHESLQDAAELALRFSKGKALLEGEVCLIQIKGLSRVKGVPGKVTLSKHKVLTICLDDKRWLRLKSKEAS